VVQDVFELQDEITRKVTSALQVKLTDGETAQLWAGGTRNLAAWELVIQIQDLLHTHRREETMKARQLAEQALALDDGYAAAWDFLGDTHWQEVFGGWSEDPEHSLGLALDAMNRSRAIDDNNPDVFAHLAFLHLSLHKYEEANDFAQKSLALGPSNPHSAAVAANVALFCNRPEDMVVMLKKAMRLCPIYPAWYVGDLAWAHLLMKRQEKAITIAQEAIGIDPDYIYTYCVLAIAYAELGRTGEAAAATENILRIDPEYSLRVFAGSQPFRDTEIMDRHLGGLRNAGLPE
jgi:adenylate cyclase